MDRDSLLIGARRLLREFACTLVDCVAPQRCVACGVLGDELCAVCRAGLRRRSRPFCPRCGAPLGMADRCDSDHRRVRGLAVVRAPLRYPGTGGAIVRQLKFGRRRGAGLWLARAMADALRDWARSTGRRSIVVSVPVHWRKRRQRGLDHAEVLAVQVAATLGLRFRSRALVRIRDTVAQGDPRVTSRAANVDGAFRLRCPRALRGRTVLLVDDVMTSGSTVRECARVLRAGGVASVGLVTACDARG